MVAVEARPVLQSIVRCFFVRPYDVVVTNGKVTFPIKPEEAREGDGNLCIELSTVMYLKKAIKEYVANALKHFLVSHYRVALPRVLDATNIIVQDPRKGRQGNPSVRPPFGNRTRDSVYVREGV